MNIKVQTLLEDFRAISDDKHQIVRQVIELAQQLNSKVELDVKYGGVVFLKNSMLLGGVFLYKKHVSVEFSNGNELKDPGELLEGKGKKRRHLKLFSTEDIKSKKLEGFLKSSFN